MYKNDKERLHGANAVSTRGGRQNIAVPASLWIRDQSTPVALSFDFHSVVTRITLSIDATREPSLASRGAAHYRVHVGLNTPHRAGR
jgi:hypothetical protein